MKVGEIKQRCDAVVETLAGVVVGKDHVLRQMLAALIANGHVLLEDYPGLAKTLIARLFCQALDLQFRRIQFSPDLLPGDITGGSVYDQREGRFEFRRGPLFADLVLADEINRATPKTQSALLEAMQERQVTIEGKSYPLGPPFLVIATQNPVELEGTYPLPEAQLDRFLVRLSVGYPEREQEQEVLRRRRERRRDAAEVAKVVSHADLLAMQASLEEIHVDASIDEYIVDLVRASRVDERVAVGVSTRGALALQSIVRAEAALNGRDFVTPDDVKSMAVPVLAHRLILRPELWVARLSAADVVLDLLKRVATPKAVTG